MNERRTRHEHKGNNDFEINFLGEQPKGKSMRSALDLLNTPGLDSAGEISTFLDDEKDLCHERDSHIC